MDYDLGFFDIETGRLGSAENPFAAKVLPMSPAPCVRVVVAGFYHEPFSRNRERHDEAVLARF